MPGMEPSKKRRQARAMRQIGLLTTIPFLMGACPLVGGWLGHWADSKFGDGILFTIIGIILGFIAAVRETIILIRKADVENQ